MSNTTFRLGTFNVENLLARYEFDSDYEYSEGEVLDRSDLIFNNQDDVKKELTAKAIKKANADILCLQEVENLNVLDDFNKKYLDGEKYMYRLLIDSFDIRRIDVAILSRFPILSVTSHRDELTQRHNPRREYLFSRDCLEVRVEIPVNEEKTSVFHLYINHFKSMYVRGSTDGREDSKEERKEQADKVKCIVDKHWEKKEYKGNFAVLGDFNDYDRFLYVGEDKSVNLSLDDNKSLNSLLNHKNLVDVLRSSDLNKNEHWTYYYKREKQYSQLDYLMLSKPLYEKACGTLNVKSLPPELTRQGLSEHVKLYEDERFEGVEIVEIVEDGRKKEKDYNASDHVPLCVDIPKDALF